MPVFSSEDPVGMVKRFEVGEYNDNLLPLIYTKVKDWINPINKKPFSCFAISDEPPQRHPQPLSKYTEGVEIFKSCNKGGTE